MKSILKIIIFSLFVLLLGYLSMDDSNASWKDEVIIKQGDCRGYRAYYTPNPHTINTCYDDFDITEYEKKRTTDHEYAHVLWHYITPTERYVWFNLHYDSKVRADFFSYYSMRGNYAHDKHRQDWYEDFADTIAYVQNNEYNCTTDICERKVRYANKLINKYY